MNRRDRFLPVVGAVMALTVFYIGGCAYNGRRIQHNFDAVAVGAEESTLVGVMGKPDAVDTASSVNTEYAVRPCEAPCVRRLWYYNVLLPGGIEAWSFELDASGRVVGASHWVSP